MKIFIDGSEYITDSIDPGIKYITTKDSDFRTNVTSALAAWDKNIGYGLGIQGPGFLNVTTSGTTGNPSRVSHSRDTIEQVVESNIKILGLNKNSRIMSLYSPKGIAFTVLSLYIAKKLNCELYIESFSGLNYINRVNSIKPSHTLILPNIWKILHKHPKWDSIDFSHCDTLLTGSDFTPQGMLEELKRHGPSKVYNVYGSTEVPPIVLYSQEENKYSGNKIPDGCEVKIVNHQLVCRWSTQSEWWESGDLVEGEINDFTLTGRQKNMFKQDNVRIYPEQIEKVAITYGADLALCKQVNTQCVLYYTGNLENQDQIKLFFSHIPRFRIKQVSEIQIDSNLKKIIRTQNFYD